MDTVTLSQFNIIEIPTDIDPEEEPLGSKKKFWVRLEPWGRGLFKEPRAGTGEDWSEKVSAELASLLDIPHASVDLARCGERRGVLSRAVLIQREELVHGNEILYERVPGYPAPEKGVKQFYHVQQHRLSTVLFTNAESHLELPLRWTPVAGITSPAEVFVGYLLFDTWIGNTDRHHENWAWVRRLGSTTAGSAVTHHLCASFDHGSSLGALISDREREERLRTRDKQYTVEAFAVRARSAFYGDFNAGRTLTTAEALRQAGKQFPNAARIWHSQLEGIPSATVASLLGRVPSDLISGVAVDFALKLLEANRRMIRQALEEIL